MTNLIYLSARRSARDAAMKVTGKTTPAVPRLGIVWSIDPLLAASFQHGIQPRGVRMTAKAIYPHNEASRVTYPWMLPSADRPA